MDTTTYKSGMCGHGRAEAPGREQVTFCQAIFFVQTQPAAAAEGPLLSRRHMGDYEGLQMPAGHGAPRVVPDGHVAEAAKLSVPQCELIM